MTVRLAVAALLAGVVSMAWGTVFWVALPLPKMVIGDLNDERAVADALDQQIPTTGIYFLPWPDESTAATPQAKKAVNEDFARRHQAGPIAQIMFRKEGLDPTAPGTLSAGFAQLVLSALLVGGLLCLAAPALPSYLGRVGFVALAGLFAAVAVDLAQPVWFHHPWEYWLMLGGFHAVNWLLAGLVMAAVIRPAAPGC